MIPVHILSAGYDHLLMQSRSMLLRHAGFVVDEAYNPLGILGVIKTDSVDAVILCHTIPQGEQRWLISSMRKERRLLPIICIKESAFDSPQDGCLIASNEPEDLLAAIRSAIQRPQA